MRYELKARATELGSRPDMVGSMGNSSGGHQAMLLGMRPFDARYGALPLLRWRPRQPGQRTESTPRRLPSGAASQLDPSHRSSPAFSRQAPRLSKGASTSLRAFPRKCGLRRQSRRSNGARPGWWSWTKVHYPGRRRPAYIRVRPHPPVPQADESLGVAHEERIGCGRPADLPALRESNPVWPEHRLATGQLHSPRLLESHAGLARSCGGDLEASALNHRRGPANLDSPRPTTRAREPEALA